MSIEDRRWVLYASQVCQVQSCQFTRAVDALETVQEVGKMAQAAWSDDVALWCGVGGHSFSQRDPGKQRVTVEQWDEEGQQVRPVTVAACGEHARPVQIATRPKVALANGGDKTPPGKKVVDAEEYQRYLDYLEDQAKEGP